MISFVLKMDSYSHREEHESSAKRLKLDRHDSYGSVLCNEIGYSNFSAPIDAQIDINEGISADCDSGYEASTMESLPTPSRQTFLTDGEAKDNFCGSLLDTHAIENLDTTQDSIEADDDNVSIASHLSELSGLSDLSGQDWKPMAQNFVWIQKQMHNRVDPRTILVELGVESTNIPQYVGDVILWKLIINMLAEPPRRHKLRHVNTLDDVVRLLKGATNIIVLTGAGVSVSCGIPDFRSRDGIYSRLAHDFPDLPDPQAMFDIGYFTRDPRPFFKFAKDIYPGKFQPSPCHRFIKLLEKNGKLLRNYTQNIDTLENVAGIQNVIECHGSFATATCTKCSRKVTANVIRDIVNSQNIPICEICQPEVGPFISMDQLKDKESTELRDMVSKGIMKPDIVFFGEGLPDSFHEAMSDDKNKCDLILVIGSSLKVRPVALIPSSLPASVPQILINRETLPHCHFDVELLGDCDVIINHLCQLMGDRWKEGVYNEEKLVETLDLLPWHPEEDVKIVGSKPDEVIAIDYTEKRAEDLASSSSSSLRNNCNQYMNTLSINSNSDEQIINSDSAKSIKERHISTDSARDSGIGENSNFTDIDTSKYDEESNKNLEQLNSENLNDSPSEMASFENNETNLKNYWQPKEKRSFTERLPEKSFYLIQPSRYIFPGAEFYIDPDEKFNYFDNSSSESSDSDSETETENVDSSF